MTPASRPSDDILLYDGECPVCSRFVAMARLRHAAPNIQVLNARQQPALVAHFLDAGMNVNDGMIIRVNDVVYYGDDALVMISSLGDGDSLFSKLMLKLFSSPRLSRHIYPTPVRGRKLLLRLLGKTEL